MYIQNTDTYSKLRVQGHQLWAKIKLKFPTEFKVYFYTQLVEYNFCWNWSIAKRKKKPQGQLLIASEKHYFYVSVSKDEWLRGEEKIRWRKENIKREKSIIQECKTVMHHSQIQ